MTLDIIDLILLVIACFSFMYFIKLIFYSVRIRSWIEPSGQILVFKKTPKSFSEARGVGLMISYQYKIGGTEYTNDKVTVSDVALPAAFRFTSPFPRVMRRLESAYHMGGALAVFVDPANHESSCLEKKLSLPQLGYFGIVFSISVLLILANQLWGIKN